MMMPFLTLLDLMKLQLLWEWPDGENTATMETEMERKRGAVRERGGERKRVVEIKRRERVREGRENERGTVKEV